VRAPKKKTRIKVTRRRPCILAGKRLFMRPRVNEKLRQVKDVIKGKSCGER